MCGKLEKKIAQADGYEAACALGTNQYEGGPISPSLYGYTEASPCYGFHCTCPKPSTSSPQKIKRMISASLFWENDKR